MEADKEVKMVINSDLRDVYLVGLLIETLCSLVHLPGDQAFWIKLCVVEAVNNSIIHAYDKVAGNEVEVLFSLYSGSLVFKVCDTGKTMPAHCLDTRMPEENDVLPGSLGIPIIREIMDEIRYEVRDGKNCLIMIKKLK